MFLFNFNTVLIRNLLCFAAMFHVKCVKNLILHVTSIITNRTISHPDLSTALPISAAVSLMAVNSVSGKIARNLRNGKDELVFSNSSLPDG